MDFNGQAIVFVKFSVNSNPSSNITITLNGQNIPVESAYNNTIGSGQGYIYILDNVKSGDQFYVNTYGYVTPYGYTTVVMYIIEQ